MDTRGWLLAVCGAVLLFGCSSDRHRSTSFPRSLEPVAVYELSDYEHGLARTKVQITEDPVYKRTKSYVAVALQPLFHGIATNFDSEVTLVFRCKDGYAPAAELRNLAGAEGFLAVRDADAGLGANWEQLPKGETPEPYYVVWREAAAHKGELPWPYQVTRIEIYRSQALLEGLTNDKSGRRQPGQQIFLHHCFQCHALNGIGGTIGPDLLSPTKATDYWRKPYLRRFISNPLSVRRNSKMPSPLLKDEEVEQVISFLSSL